MAFERGVASGRPRNSPPTIRIATPRSLRTARPVATASLRPIASWLAERLALAAGFERCLARLRLRGLRGVGLRPALADGTSARRHPDIGLALAGRLDRARLAFLSPWLAAEAAAFGLAEAALGFVEAGLGAALAEGSVRLGRQLAQRLVAAAFAALAGLDQPAFAAWTAVALPREFRPFGLVTPRLAAPHRLVGERLRYLGVEIGAGFLDQPLAELVAQHAALDLQHMTLRQILELERPVGNADQPRHLEAKRAEDVSHLAVLAFAQTDRQPGVGALLAVERCFDRSVEHAVDGDAFAQIGKRLILDLAVDAHAIAPQPAGGRQFEHPRQPAVIGEQQQSFR